MEVIAAVTAIFLSQVKFVLTIYQIGMTKIVNVLARPKKKIAQKSSHTLMRHFADVSVM